MSQTYGRLHAVKSQALATIHSLDQRLLLTIQSWRLPLLNRSFLLLTYSGTGKAWLIFAAALNFLNFRGIHFVDNQTSFMKALFSPLLAWILGSVFKRIFARQRPSHAIQGYVQLIPSPTCSSFPSSHAAASIAFFVALCLIHHPLAVAVGIWAILVSFSRLYLGVHYLSDILGGALLGSLSAAIVTTLL